MPHILSYIHYTPRTTHPPPHHRGEADSTTPTPHHTGGRATVLWLTHDHIAGGGRGLERWTRYASILERETETYPCKNMLPNGQHGANLPHFLPSSWKHFQQLLHPTCVTASTRNHANHGTSGGMSAGIGRGIKWLNRSLDIARFGLQLRTAANTSFT